MHTALDQQRGLVGHAGLGPGAVKVGSGSDVNRAYGPAVRGRSDVVDLHPATSGAVQPDDGGIHRRDVVVGRRLRSGSARNERGNQRRGKRAQVDLS